MGSQPKTQTVINKTELPPWIDAAAKKNLEIADQLAQRPYVPYTDNITAGASPLQQSAWQNALANVGAYSGAINTAADTFAGGTTYQPRSFLQGNIADYMNPYIQNVEDRAIANQNRAFLDNLNQIAATATKAGAFGGSRHGIAEGVASAENARAVGDLSAQLRAQAFDAASQNLNADLNRDLQGQQLRMDAAGNLVSTAQAGQQMSNQDTALLSALGLQQRDIEQAQLQEQYAKWKEQQDHPLQQLNLRLAAVGATPYGSTQTQTATGAGGGNAGLSVLGGVLGLLPLIFSSDKDDKTDIEEIGVDPKTGLKMYAYRYKGDPKSYPKVVGPMAQDIEKVAPRAVRQINGHKVVNLGFGG